jgi:hypothetical protein
MIAEPLTTESTAVKTIKLVVAMAKGMSHLQEALSQAVKEVNQKAAEENRGAQIEVLEWYQEETYSGFYRESPRILIERIINDNHPDGIIALFQKRFGTERLGDGGPPGPEFDRFAQLLRQPGSPHTLLYFLEKDFNPQTAEEHAQKNYFTEFRAYFLPLLKLWWWFKTSRALQKLVTEELWEFVRQRTQPDSSVWTDKPSLTLELPDGWQHINEIFLSKERSNLGDDHRLSPEDAASFFDGESPKWRYIVSKSIRPREWVTDLVKELTESAGKGRIRVTLLIGPGGEGKSTILQQVAVGLVESQSPLNVIWRDLKATKPTRLEKTWLQPLLKQEQPFVFVIDNADQLVEDIWQIVVDLSDQQSNIQFLLSSRSLDWEWVKADSKPWRRTLGGTNYQPKEIRALTEEDARRIVQAWEEAGAEGLGDFIKVEPGERAYKLFSLAKEEEQKNPKEGSFLGAMLDARKSETFRDYIRDILRRLEGRVIPGGKTLQDAYTYIVALHADNQRILTRPILRHLLGCSMNELEHDIIRPLVDEADVASSFLVLARHIAIARTARQILSEQEFRVKFETQILPFMVGAAIKKFKAKDGEMKQEEISPWNKLPRYYAEELKQIAVALRLAEALAEAEPEDPLPVITWANLYRHNNQRKAAVEVFRQRYAGISAQKLNKGFFTEWAAAESRVDNYCHDAWLSGIALSDSAPARHPGESMPMIPLSSLTTSFITLYKVASDAQNTTFYNPEHARIFLEGCAAASQLGFDDRVQRECSEYDKRKSKNNFERGRKLARDNNIQAVNTDEAINRIRIGIILAWELRGKDKDWDSIPTSLPSADRLSFRGLRGLLND